jgi:hypothetical protein
MGRAEAAAKAGEMKKHAGQRTDTWPARPIASPATRSCDAAREHEGASHRQRHSHLPTRPTIRRRRLRPSSNRPNCFAVVGRQKAA